jgi:hypothetical protein
MTLASVRSHKSLGPEVMLPVWLVLVLVLVLVRMADT